LNREYPNRLAVSLDILSRFRSLFWSGIFTFPSHLPGQPATGSGAGAAAGLVSTVPQPTCNLAQVVWLFPKIYLLCQTALIFTLLSRPGFFDFFGSLLPILGMQVMLHLNPKIGALWMGLCAPIMILLLVRTYGTFQAIALTLIFTAGNVFLGAYTLAMRRAQAAHLQNQALARELQEANDQLHDYSTRLEQQAVARERNRLARELHDSVTQTVFSMTLTTQSALLLLDRDLAQVGFHLERLNQLARSALAEMQLLISELEPDKAAKEGLVPVLRRHLAGSRLPDTPVPTHCHIRNRDRGCCAL